MIQIKEPTLKEVIQAIEEEDDNFFPAQALSVSGEWFLSSRQVATALTVAYERETLNSLEKLSDIKELLENALYQPLSSSEVEGNTQAVLDLLNRLIGE